MSKKNPSQEKFKILLLNLGYCTGINGSLAQYISKFYRYIFLHSKVEKMILNKFKKIVLEEDPDLICLTEIKQGKQIKTLINGKYFFYDIETKYGQKSILRKLPFFHNKGNAFISKHKLSFKKHYLINGTKKLLYEIIIPGNISLILMHFSLKKRARGKQFKEIQKMFSGTGQKIICGDFNILGGISELNCLANGLDLKLAHQEPTFPAFRPNKPLDLFLCSKNIKTKTRILNNQLSDHLPVIVEISL